MLMLGLKGLKGLKHSLLRPAISVIANHLSWFFKQSIIDTISFSIRLIELDSYSNSHVIGQVELSLSEVDFGEPQPRWYDIAGEQKVKKKKT